MALNLGDNPGQCDELAQKHGALAWVGDACVPVSGRVIEIGDSAHSIMEGFEITNFNFHANGNKPSVPTQHNLPGAAAGGAMAGGSRMITA